MNAKIRHLEEHLQQLTDPILQIDVLNQLAFELRHTDTVQSMQRSQEAVRRAEAIGYSNGLATGLLNQGFSDMVQSRYGQALSALAESIVIFDSLNDELGKAHALYNCGVVYIRIGDYENALERHKQSLAIRQTGGDQRGEADCLSQLGYINEQFGKPEEAEKNYEQSLAIRRTIDDQPGIAAVLIGLGRINQKRHHFDQAKQYLAESLHIRKSLGEVHGWLASMHAMSDLCLEQNLLTEAEDYLVKALTFALQQKEPYAPGLCRLRINLAKVYMRSDRFKTAVDSLQDALVTAQETNQNYLIHDIYFSLSEAYKLTGDYQQALDMYERYHRQKEDIINLEATTKLKNIELLNQIEAKKKEAEIYRLRHIELKLAYDQLSQTQQQLIQAEKMAYFGQLTSGIAHEIQNPLNFVNNFSEISTELISELEEEHLKPEHDTELEAELLSDLKQNLQKITHHGGRASAIVRAMLDHSRSSTGTKQPTNLNTLVDEYLRISYHALRAKDKNFQCEILTNFALELPSAEVIPQELGRVLLNVFNNAFYAVQQKQKTALFAYHPTITVSTAQLDGNIQIQVGDNGSGIPESIRAKIFQPFFTTKPTGEGTGLGLSLSYDIVTKGHGGALLVQSQEGESTEFIIELPIAKAGQVDTTPQRAE